MHVVIDISDEDYRMIKENDIIVKLPRGYGKTIMDDLFRAIQNGTPLPKGHGRLKDYDWIDENCDIHHSDIDGSWCYKIGDLEAAPTIVEADKE